MNAKATLVIVACVQHFAPALHPEVQFLILPTAADQTFRPSIMPNS